MVSWVQIEICELAKEIKSSAGFEQSYFVTSTIRRGKTRFFVWVVVFESQLLIHFGESSSGSCQ